MSRTYFSTAEQLALDSYDVPPMRTGFADRVVRQAFAGPVPGPSVDGHMAKRRYRSPWARAGRRAGIFIAFGFVSAAAAALGIFGQPERIPVVGELIAQALVEETTITDTPARTKPAPAIASIPVEPAPLVDGPLDQRDSQNPRPAPAAAPRIDIAPSRDTARENRAAPATIAPDRMRRVDLPRSARVQRLEAPEASQRQRLAERVSEIRDAERPPPREQIAERIAERRESLAEAEPQPAAIAPLADPAVAPRPDATIDPPSTALPTRNAARQRLRAQLRKRRETARDARPASRDIARQRRALRKRRR